MEESALLTIRTTQRHWAKEAGIPVNEKGYTQLLDDNMLFSMSDATRGEFEHGDGNELSIKMRALHSSSALAVNVFEYWRDRSTSVLALALGLLAPISIKGFEKKYPTGLRGNAPNLDVVIQTTDGMVAIESKFTEPYSKGPSDVSEFKTKYLDNKKLWLDLGLPKCQKLASDISEGRVGFTMLDVQQLLKHILGLQKSEDKPRLLYLWYSVPGKESERHTREIEQFAARVDDQVGFYSLTYQDLFSVMCYPDLPEHKEYLTKLGDRYFKAEANQHERLIKFEKTEML